MTQELPLRLTVRVIIQKGDLVAMGELRNPDGSLRCYNFPGGGVEPGQTMEQAVEAEALEEAGIRVKNIRHTGFNLPAKHVMHVASRNASYSGTDSHYFTADFDSEDMSRYNIEGDAVKIVWVTPAQGKAMILAGPPSEFNQVRLDMLDMLGTAQ